MRPSILRVGTWKKTKAYEKLTFQVWLIFCCKPTHVFKKLNYNITAIPFTVIKTGYTCVYILIGQNLLFLGRAPPVTGNL